MHILLLFVDGVGLGERDPEQNPFLVARMPVLHGLFGEIPTRAQGRYDKDTAILIPTDTTLGIPGVPQSGTGQTTIFTGINAAAAIGTHEGPYPNATLREIIAGGSLFQQVRAAGLSAEMGNAYPPIFFERLARNKARRTATMQAAIAAGVRMRDIHDLRAGHAVSAFSLTNRAWVERGAPVPLVTARQAGRNLMRLAQENDFTAFEYFLTDAAGHKNDHAWILEVLAELDEFWGGLLEEQNLAETLLLITSDHGNIEDWTVKGHTLNPVPTILIGAGREEAASRIHSLVDITPTVMHLLIAKELIGRG